MSENKRHDLQIIISNFHQLVVMGERDEVIKNKKYFLPFSFSLSFFHHSSLLSAFLPSFFLFIHSCIHFLLFQSVSQSSIHNSDTYINMCI